MGNAVKSIFIICVALFLCMGATPMPLGMSASGRKVLIVNPYEWARGFATRTYQMGRPTVSWNYDPLWYDLRSRNGKHKRMTESGDENGGEGIRKRLFVARVGKRTARVVHWARVG